MKRNMRDAIVSFITGKGFYIVLLLCVTTLGVSGYYLFSGLEKQRPASGPATVVVTPTAQPEHSVPPAETAGVTPTAPSVATPRPTPAATAAPTPQPKTSAPAATPAATATASVFTWPVKGEVLRAYAIETLAYDITMRDWRTHDGVDISCPAGTAVMAPAGGTVIDLYTDDFMGVTVVIAHSNVVVSACANLESIPTVEIGDTVRTGDIIGAVGSSAIMESRQASHLHLSMTRDGVSVDPLDYLPQK